PLQSGCTPHSGDILNYNFPAMHSERRRSSRQRYLGFVRDYKQHRLDDAAEKGSLKSGKRREYLREYVRWLWPHRAAVIAVLVLALLVAGLQLVEPLFMRF